MTTGAENTGSSEGKVTVEGNGTPGTGLAVMAAPTALDFLRQELQALKTITESEYRTDGKVDSFNGTSIKDEKNIDVLVKMASVIFTRAKAYNEAQTRLGVVEVKPFSMNGHSEDAYEADIKLRIAVLKHAERKAELEALVKEGESFLTKEDQFQMYLKKLAAATGGKVGA